MVWTVQMRRRRLVRRHHLDRTGVGTRGLVDVVGDLVGLHATDPVSMFLQAHARVGGLSAGDVEAVLYDQRALARVLAMRRTMFVVQPDDMPMLRAAVTDRLATGELRRTASWLEYPGLDGRGPVEDGVAWVRDAGALVVEALERHGPMTANDLKAHVPALAEGVTLHADKPYGGRVGMSTRVLFWLATVGSIVRARPRGSIASTAWTWASTGDWLGPDAVAEGPDAVEAAAALARRYLAAFGPATTADLQWWTGWTRTLTRQALALVGPTEVAVEDGHGGTTTALVLPGDDEPTAEHGPGDPTVALLPALDATPMGWRERAWYLGRHTTFPGPLFDRNGNVGPTVWVDGQVVGAWAQRGDGEVVWRLFDEVAATRSLEDAIAASAADVAAFLGEVRFTPRFPTPWQVDLGT